MATNTGKGKKKGNKKTIPLSMLLAEDTNAPQGFNVVNTRKLDWAESMEEELDDKFTLNYKRADTTKVLLPTAPKATRGPDIDMTRVPSDPPFKAYIGNLPYDVSDQEIVRYFSKLNIKDVRLPTFQGRQRGFAYAEFEDRQSLIDALTMNGDMFRNRIMKVGLPGDGSDNTRDSNREERQDRTAGDWRTAPREEPDDSRDTPRDNYQNNYSRNGSNYDNSDKSMQRSRGNESRSFGRNYENDRTFRPSNDRGFERSNNYSNDRGFDRPNDRGYDRQSNDRGFDRQSNDRGFDRPNNRYNNRTEGQEEYRDQGFDSMRRNDDSNRYQSRNFNERRNEGRREFGGGFDRNREREDTHYDGRSSPTPNNDGAEERPRERQKLKLQPRSKPLETEGNPVANSAIFGGAKPVDTAAREQVIEQKLLKEKEESDKKREITTDERTRRISSSSNHSATSRSRKGSDSGKDFDDNYRNGSRRNRKTSERSNPGSDTAPKFIMTRSKDNDSTHANRYVSVRSTEDKSYSRGGGGGQNRNNNNNNSRRPRDRDREHRDSQRSQDGYYRPPPRMSSKSEEDEEKKKVAYITSNKFAHLATDDYEDDGPHNGSDD